MLNKSYNSAKWFGMFGEPAIRCRLLSVAVVNIVTKSNLREEKICLADRLQFIIEGKQDRNSRQEQKQGPRRKCCLLVCSL